MVPLPYKILAVVIFALLVFGSGSYVGYQYCDGQVAKAAADAQNAALNRAGEEADADKQDAIKRARREAVAQERTRSARSKGELDAGLKANPGCSRDDESLGLLLESIAAANGTAPAAGSMPQAMPGIAGPGKRDRSGDPGLGVRIK